MFHKAITFDTDSLIIDLTKVDLKYFIDTLINSVYKNSQIIYIETEIDGEIQKFCNQENEWYDIPKDIIKKYRLKKIINKYKNMDFEVDDQLKSSNGEFTFFYHCDLNEFPTINDDSGHEEDMANENGVEYVPHDFTPEEEIMVNFMAYDLDTIIFTNDKPIKLDNVNCESGDDRGANQTPVRLPCNGYYMLSERFTLREFMDGCYLVKMKKFNRWYELYCRCEVNNKDDDCVTIDMDFDYGS